MNPLGTLAPGPNTRPWSDDPSLDIGCGPGRLVAELLAHDGLLLVEVEPGDLDERVTVAVEDASGRCGPAFRWARLGARATVRCAADAGFAPVDAWTRRGRHFLALRR